MTPECGSKKCELQAKNHQNDHQFGLTITISFTLVIRSEPSTLQAIIDKIGEINISLEGLVEGGLTFGAGTTSGE